MLDVGCSMLDVRCWMFYVGCPMFSASSTFDRRKAIWPLLPQPLEQRSAWRGLRAGAMPDGDEQPGGGADDHAQAEGVHAWPRGVPGNGDALDSGVHQEPAEGHAKCGQQTEDIRLGDRAAIGIAADLR